MLVVFKEPILWLNSPDICCFLLLLRILEMMDDGWS